jgi:hypothetical protein
MASVLGDVRWPWIPGIAGGVAAALFGYTRWPGTASPARAAVRR